MALVSLGRNVAVSERVRPVGSVGVKTAEEVREEANEKIDDARKGLLDTLAPWIPGDFVVTYGALLTAWSALRANFPWLLIISAASAFTYVVLGAFAETGFKNAADRSSKVKRKLLYRTIAGFGVSVCAAVAIPTSGWYDFGWFVRNELACIVTAGFLVVAVVFVLKGVQERFGVSLAMD